MSHPLFGTAHTPLPEQINFDGESQEVLSIKITEYSDCKPEPVDAIAGQPVPHIYFDRTLRDLLGQCFRAGLVMDALEEPVFPKELSPEGGSSDLTDHFRRFPPALVVRLRRPGGAS